MQHHSISPSQAGKTILGERVYSRIDEIDHPVDIIDVFRPSAEVPDIARQAVKIKAKVLWLQLGIISEDGGKIARDGGLEVVMDRCCKIEHARFFGGLRTIVSIPASSPPDWRSENSCLKARRAGHDYSVVIGMLYTQMQTSLPFCYNWMARFWEAVHQALIRARRLSRDKTLNRALRSRRRRQHR